MHHHPCCGFKSSPLLSPFLSLISPLKSASFSRRHAPHTFTVAYFESLSLEFPAYNGFCNVFCRTFYRLITSTQRLQLANTGRGNVDDNFDHTHLFLSLFIGERTSDALRSLTPSWIPWKRGEEGAGQSSGQDGEGREGGEHSGDLGRREQGDYEREESK